MKKMVQLLTSAMLVAALLTGCGGASGETQTQGAGTADEPLKFSWLMRTPRVRMAFIRKWRYCSRGMYPTFPEEPMEIEIVGNGQLGGERDLVEGMQLGTIEMASTANMVLSNFDPRFAVLDLPYLITDYETAYRVLDSDVIQDLQDSFAEQSGVRVLAYGQGGFRQVIGNVAVNSLADMHGMKVRVPESDIYIDTFSALGANPTPLAYSETFTALQQGTVDAFEITPAVVLSAGFWEVCSDMNMTNHLFSPNPLMISENLFQSLTEEQQDILTEAAAKAAADQRQWLEDGEADTMAQLEEKGMTINYPDLEELQNAVADSGLYEKYQETIGADLFSAVQELCQ